MATFTATVIPGLAAVRLEATGIPNMPATITRHDVNGDAIVRQLPGQSPSGGTLIVTDYEPALTGAVSYHINTGSGVADPSVTLDWPSPVLHVAGRPNLRADVTAVTGYGETTESPAAVVRVLDREDPLILLAPHYLPAGTMTVWCGSYADARTVATVARAGKRVMFRQADHAGMDRYLAVTGSALDPIPAQVGATQRWAVRLDYAEVTTPAGDLQAAAGWDLDALTASFATFNAVQATFATFNAVTVGP